LKITSAKIEARAAIDNITNRRYWMFQYSDYIAPGDPRMVSVNAKIDF
jgi:iron complex outermembrane receptor protein